MEIALEARKNGRLVDWMIKQANVHRGQGIEVLTDKNWNRWLDVFEEGKGCVAPYRGPEIIAQRYVKDLLFIEGRKFHMRTYMVVVHVNPTITYFVPLFLVRRAFEDFDPNSADLSKALSNRNFAGNLGVKDDSLLTAEFMQDYFYKDGTFSDPKWVTNQLVPKLRRLQAHVANAWPIKPTAKSRFELMGLDILMRANLEVNLLEVNRIPVLHNEPIKLKEEVMDTMASIMTQVVVEGKSRSKDIDSGIYMPIYDQNETGSDRYFGVLNEQCYFEPLSGY
mmetsp:Transcript_13532/g.14998  ORF Transcript_13532/g.14998 Transcript_13532/m.14998 type:complete len:280 (-) Transcript_13532:58-897(-)